MNTENRGTDRNSNSWKPLQKIMTEIMITWHDSKKTKIPLTNTLLNKVVGVNQISTGPIKAINHK